MTRKESRSAFLSYRVRRKKGGRNDFAALSIPHYYKYRISQLFSFTLRRSRTESDFLLYIARGESRSLCRNEHGMNSEFWAAFQAWFAPRPQHYLRLFAQAWVWKGRQPTADEIALYFLQSLAVVAMDDSMSSLGSLCSSCRKLMPLK